MMTERNPRHDSGWDSDHSDASRHSRRSEPHNRGEGTQTTPRDRGGADAGKTMGGGSSGHKSSDRETPE